ncbi:thiol-disulfide oxidoreductase DCC family protein [Salana multivorans]
MAARTGVLVINGCCGVCARSADLLARLDRHARVTIVPSQGPGVLECYGLTPERAAESVWFVPTRGHRQARQAPVLGRARAVAAALDTVLGVRLFSALAASRALGGVLDRCYRWFAANRSRFPGATPWCERDPGCGPA